MAESRDYSKFGIRTVRDCIDRENQCSANRHEAKVKSEDVSKNKNGFKQVTQVTLNSGHCLWGCYESVSGLTDSPHPKAREAKLIVVLSPIHTGSNQR